MSLYDLMGQYAELQAMLEYGANNPEEEQAIADTMAAITDDFEDKAEGYAKIRRNLTAKIDAIKAEEERLYNRRKALENGVARINDSMMTGMTLFGKKKLNMSIGTWSIQKNPPSVKVNNQDAIPAEYWTTPAPTLNRKAILEDMKQGVIVEGCEIQQTEGLRFR